MPYAHAAFAKVEIPEVEGVADTLTAEQEDSFLVDTSDSEIVEHSTISVVADHIHPALDSEIVAPEAKQSSVEHTEQSACAVVVHALGVLAMTVPSQVESVLLKLFSAAQLPETVYTVLKQFSETMQSKAVNPLNTVFALEVHMETQLVSAPHATGGDESVGAARQLSEMRTSPVATVDIVPTELMEMTHGEDIAPALVHTELVGTPLSQAHRTR